MRYQRYNSKAELTEWVIDKTADMSKVTKGYMDHMKKVNKGQAYKYPSMGKGEHHENI